MQDGLANPYDRFFKGLLDLEGCADALLRERLPSKAVARLDPPPAEPVPGSFVEEQLRTYYSDRLYRLRMRPGRPANRPDGRL